MRHDVVVVGAGPVGSTLALALAAGGIEAVVLDGRAAGETPRGDRSLAVSHGARLILERIGVWDALRDTPDALTPIVGIEIGTILQIFFGRPLAPICIPLLYPSARKISTFEETSDHSSS